MLRTTIFCLVFVALLGTGVLAAECLFALEEPTLITSLGQNLDGLIIKTALAEMGMKTDFLPLAAPEDLKSYRQVVISPGISYKGIASAGITIESEIERTKTIIETAREYSIRLVLLYLGGFIQSDAQSRQLLEILAPDADAIVVYKECKEPLDYFLDIAENKGIPLFVIENLGNICGELTKIFSE